MIKIKPDDIIEWDGFDVYDVETGDNLSPDDVVKNLHPGNIRMLQLVDGFGLSWDGILFLTFSTGATGVIPKEGKYLVQINGEKFMRW